VNVAQPATNAIKHRISARTTISGFARSLAAELWIVDVSFSNPAHLLPSQNGDVRSIPQHTGRRNLGQDLRLKSETLVAWAQHASRYVECECTIS
jgi:hypothetical protein